MTGAVALPPPLGRDFFARSSVALARDLLGRWLIRLEPDGTACGGPIVETEAYDGPQDRASHARFGRTARNDVMFGPPGQAYVYLVYGLHCLLNVVSETDGVPGAILLRAIEPAVGIQRMAARRGLARPPIDPALLAAGPARLTQALAVDRGLNGVDLAQPGALYIGDPGAGAVAAARASGILEGPRVGIGYAGEPWTAIAWRFGLAGSRSLSRRFPRGAAPTCPPRP